MSRQSELRNLLAAFGKGHQNIINLTLHVFTFPVLVASAAMVLDTLGGRHPMPISWDPIFSTFFATYLHSSPYWTVGGLVLLTYTLYYVKFDPFIGTLWGICVALPGFIYGQRAIDTLHPAWLWALGVHIASWTVQYIGHQIEGSPLAMKDKSNNTGRRPIMRVLLPIAPFYAWIIPICMIFGYRKELLYGVQKDIAVALKQR